MDKMKVGIVATDGFMGKLLEEIVTEREGMEPVTLEDDFDVIIDFTHPDNLNMIIDKAIAADAPAVLATTGYTEEQEQQINELAKKVPVVYCSNFSTGVTVVKRLLKEISPILKDDYDMEIVERHHRRKLDAPSGTAKMLAKAMNPDNEFEQVDGRSGMRKRGHEIGVSAVRGGTIVGVHTAIYAGDDEVIEIKHTAGSRRIFANGSLTAAEWALKAKPGLYDMEDVLFGE